MPLASRKGSRPFQDHRRVVEAIAWRFDGDGTWDRIHAGILADADAAGKIDWAVGVGSTVNRVHQHVTNLPRDTGGRVELHESAGRTA